MNANKIITLSRSITNWKSMKEMHRTGPAATRKMLFHPAAKKLINGAVSSKKNYEPGTEARSRNSFDKALTCSLVGT